jgi:hypothetical protein
MHFCFSVDSYNGPDVFVEEAAASLLADSSFFYCFPCLLFSPLFYKA